MINIKFAVIPPEHTVQAQEYAAMLRDAVQAGKMRTIDETAAQLILLADPVYTCSFPETYWKDILHTIRSVHPEFRADYILNTDILKTLIDSAVLTSYADAVRIITQALAVKGAVMQLPFDDEDV